MTLRGLKTVLHTPMMVYQLRYMASMGFWAKGCFPIFKQRIISFLSKTFMELPILIVSAVVLTLSKKHFYIVVILATAIV